MSRAPRIKSDEVNAMRQLIKQEQAKYRSVTNAMIVDKLNNYTLQTTDENDEVINTQSKGKGTHIFIVQDLRIKSLHPKKAKP